jgi:CheY-like chemotaxis protein
MRILIAEDDSALATFVRKGLEAEHYAVNVSQNGSRHVRGSWSLTVRICPSSPRGYLHLVKDLASPQSY